jgi:hypothetical protein
MFAMRALVTDLFKSQCRLEANLLLPQSLANHRSLSTRSIRLIRSLLDCAKIVYVFDAHSVSFVSVTQAFNTALTLPLEFPSGRAPGKCQRNLRASH